MVEDVTQDPRFSTKEYAGGGISFYAGVPIVSQNRFAIRVFNVTDNKPRPGGLIFPELQFMQDMASTVMDHLENIRNDTARHRGERMVLGLGAFSEGHTSLDTDSDNSYTEDDAHSENSHTGLVRSTFKGLTISDTAPKAPMPTSLGEEPPSLAGQRAAGAESFNSVQAQSPVLQSAAPPESRSESSRSQGIVINTEAEHDKVPTTLSPQDSLHSRTDRRTFARAATILRQSTDSDGVMFFDASFSSTSDALQSSLSSHRTNSNETTSSDEAHDTSGGSSDDFYGSIEGDANQSDFKHKAGSKRSRDKSKAKYCQLLGFFF